VKGFENRINPTQGTAAVADVTATLFPDQDRKDVSSDMKDDMPQQQKFFLGRQPILDTQMEIVAYELLFRSSENNVSDYVCQEQACMSVIANSLVEFGFREVLGNKLGFINVTEEVLLSDLVELLPRDQIVIELLETACFDEAVLERCRQLKIKNYQIALDDHIYAPEHHKMYRTVDIIKIDILDTPAELLPLMAKKLKQFPIRLLAEKVETEEQFQECIALGFDLFQGYFFARPTVLNQSGIEPSKLAMLKLLGSLRDEAEFDEIEEIFKTSPELSYNLLKLVNSVYIGLREKIRSLRHAIILIGLGKLRRWVQLAMYAGSDSRGGDNPLLEMAAVRGRLMECLIMKRHSLPRGSDAVDAAFMTGMLSMLDALLGVSIEEVIQQLRLSDEIASALLRHEGELGTLLELTEILEQTKFDQVQLLVEKNDITVSSLLDAQLDAYNWRTGMRNDT